MKYTLRRFAAVLLIFALVTQVGAAVLGDAVLQYVLPLTTQSTLTQTTWQGGIYSARQENVLTYVPGGDESPSVVYGTTLFGKSPMDAIESYPDAWGFSVVAGINGSFFDVDTGIPYGCVITGGAVRTSGNLEAIGLKADGTAIIGVPDLHISVQLPTMKNPMEVHVNKALTKSNGMVLYTRDYDSRTKNGISAYNVALMPDTPDLIPGKTLTCTVTGIFPDKADCTIPSGGFLLSMATDSNYAATLETALKPLATGDTVTVDISISEAWQDVVSACAGMEMLLENGQVRTDFTLASAKKRTARTAVGLKEDGSLVFYTVDYGTGKTGLTLEELALRLQELGCITALNLDGGGSTAIRALYPGMEKTQTVNTPSDGALRKCANFLFLTRPKQEPGEAKLLFAYPYDAMALIGGEIPLTVTATDENYIAAPVPEEISAEAVGGTYLDGVFIAQQTGTATLSLKSETAEGSLSILVVETPDSITVTRESDGKAAGGSLISRETLDFTASAKYLGRNLYVKDTSFVWTCDSAIGTVDETGLFTAGTVYVPTTGAITCAAGEVSKEISITVLPDNPFPDTETHWAKDYVRTMYDLGVLKGSDVGGVPHFRPDDNMTRQEFIVSLMRYLNAEAEPAELPFADTETIAPWALDAMTLAYTLGYLNGSMEQGVLYCKPTSSITRQEAMVILSRTLPETELTEDPLALFPDADAISDWARDGLSRMVHLGIISGMSDGTLSPMGTVTRAQVAKMLAVMQTLPEPTDEPTEESAEDSQPDLPPVEEPTPEATEEADSLQELPEEAKEPTE